MFRNEIEFAKALLDGRQFKDEEGNTYFVRWDTASPEFLVRYSFAAVTASITDFWSRYSKVTELPPWTDEIPAHGTLCWVRDSKAARWEIDIILEYQPDRTHPYRRKDDIGWKEAIPLTNDEIKQFLR